MATIKSTDETSKESQQTQSTAMSDIIAVFILSSKSEIFWACDIEPEYLEPHNSACKCWNPLSSSGVLILIVVYECSGCIATNMANIILNILLIYLPLR